MDIESFTKLSSMQSYSNLTMNKEMFVVQRCWHSGPQQYQPLDYLRLFLSQRDAEEAAYHSAHAWSKYHTPHSEPQVKTLMLPSYPAHNATGSSYGFIAHGSLFWVRSTMTTVSPGGSLQEGYAIVTEGVIGGTGNRNSRRGTEVPTGHVFCGSMTNSRMQALQVCHQVIGQLGSHVNVNVATLPIGKTQEFSSGDFLKDWPPQVLQPNLLHSTSMNNEHKRQNHHFLVQNDTDLNEPGVLVDCPFEMPPTKRRRFCKMEESGPSSHQHNEVMMSYGVAGEQA
jgi:hypothetical protein